jgi:hypothetical protein
MSGWIDAVISPLKAAGGTAQRLLEIRDTVKFGEAIAKLQSELLSAQRGALTAQEREATLLDEVMQLKRRNSELEAKLEVRCNVRPQRQAPVRDFNLFTGKPF